VKAKDVDRSLYEVVCSLTQRLDPSLEQTWGIPFDYVTELNYTSLSITVLSIGVCMTHCNYYIAQMWLTRRRVAATCRKSRRSWDRGFGVIRPLAAYIPWDRPCVTRQAQWMDGCLLVETMSPAHICIRLIRAVFGSILLFVNPTIAKEHTITPHIFM